MYFVILCILLYLHMDNQFIEKWQSQVKKGSLSFIVLLVLKDRELYGYELIEKIKGLTNIDIAEGTLYPLLNRLKTERILESKWVEQETGIPRKYYFLTKSGNETLTEMKNQWIKLQDVLTKIM